MVCDSYVAHAFKPDVCRECGMKKALHTNLITSSAAATPATATVRPTPTPAAVKPIVAAKPAIPVTTATPVATAIKPVSTASAVQNGNGTTAHSVRPLLSTSAALSKPATTSASSSSAATVSPFRAAVSASPAAAMSTSTASATAAVKNSKACDTFTAHSFFPNKCRECNQPKADHAPSAIPAPAPTTTTNTAAASSAALKTTPVKFSSPFKAPSTAPTAAASVSTVHEPTVAAVPSVTAASTASTSIKQRLASLGGGFNPLLMTQPLPAAKSSAPSVDVSSSYSAGSESMSSPASAVRKPSIGVTRRQPSAESLPQFVNTGPSTNGQFDTEVRSEETKAAHEEQQVDKPVAVAHTTPVLSAAAPHAHVAVPVVDSVTSGNELFSPASSVAAAAPTAESKASALIGSSKHADLWDEEDRDGLGSQPAPVAFISDSQPIATPSTSLSTSSQSVSATSDKPAGSSMSEQEATVSSVSSYLARQKVTTVPVVASKSSSLFGDDWDDEDDDVQATKPTASKPITIAPTSAAAAQGSEKRGLFDDVEKDENDELFSPPPVIPAMHAAQPTPAAAAPAVPSTAADTPAPAPAITASSSASVSAPSSAAEEAAAAPMSAADFYAKQAEAATTTASPAPPVNKPAVPARVSSSVFFKPGGALSTASLPSTSASTAASAASSSPSSSRPSVTSSAAKQGVFFKVNSLGFEQKVSDAVTVVPVSQGRITEPAKATVTSTSESSKLPDYVEDAKGKHVSSLVTPPTTVPTTKSTANLFDDEDVDDSQLFSAAPHPLGIVGRVTSPVREVKGTGDLFGDSDDTARPPAIMKQHSNVFENDGFAGF